MAAKCEDRNIFVLRQYVYAHKYKMYVLATCSLHSAYELFSLPSTHEQHVPLYWACEV